MKKYHLKKRGHEFQLNTDSSARSEAATLRERKPKKGVTGDLLKLDGQNGAASEKKGTATTTSDRTTPN